MSFLFFTDAHIKDGQPYGTDRLADQDAILDKIVDLAVERQVDGVLFGGDLFHYYKPWGRELHVARGFFAKLAAASIPTIAITGNRPHDVTNPDIPSALELFRSDYVRVSRTPELIRAAGDVAVCTLPWAPVDRLVAARGTHDEANDLAVALLIEAAAELRAQVPAGWPSILLGHWSVSGSMLPTGLPVSSLDGVVLPLDALEGIGFDAILLGHIHTAGEFGRNDFQPVLYGGTPYCMDFGEADVDHGCWIIDPLAAGGASAEFVPLGDRRFITVDVDLTDPDRQMRTDGLGIGLDETDHIAAAFETIELPDAVVKIKYRATEEQHRRVDVAALKGFCMEAGAHKVFQVVPEIIRANRARVEGVTEDLTAEQALELWCDSQELDATKRQGLHALLEELDGVPA